MACFCFWVYLVFSQQTAENSTLSARVEFRAVKQRIHEKQRRTPEAQVPNEDGEVLDSSRSVLIVHDGALASENLNFSNEIHDDAETWGRGVTCFRKLSMLVSYRMRIWVGMILVRIPRIFSRSVPDLPENSPIRCAGKGFPSFMSRSCSKSGSSLSLTTPM